MQHSSVSKIGSVSF